MTPKEIETLAFDIVLQDACDHLDSLIKRAEQMKGEPGAAMLLGILKAGATFAAEIKNINIPETPL